MKACEHIRDRSLYAINNVFSSRNETLTNLESDMCYVVIYVLSSLCLLIKQEARVTEILYIMATPESSDVSMNVPQGLDCGYLGCCALQSGS
jgi:hypothetical protein